MGENQTFIDDMMVGIDEWLQTSGDKTLILAPVNAFLRRLQYQELGRRYAQGLVWEGGETEDKRRCVVVRRATVQEKAERERGDAHAREANVVGAVGFRYVIEAMAQAGKPVVGHNMLLDLALTCMCVCACRGLGAY